MKKLSERLKTIASLVPFGARVCDIGTDHGYLSIELALHGGIESVIATDINEKPLELARKNIAASGAKGIELRLCDGLSGISPGEIDIAVIAGIGGEVIAGIIERGAKVAKDGGLTFLLQPTTSPEFLREFLFKNGYEILFEEAIFENRKLYSVIVCRFNGQETEYEPYNCFLGKVSPDTKYGRLYIKKQFERCFKCAKALKNIEEKQAEYNYYNSVAENLRKLLNL